MFFIHAPRKLTSRRLRGVLPRETAFRLQGGPIFVTLYPATAAAANLNGKRVERAPARKGGVVRAGNQRLADDQQRKGA